MFDLALLSEERLDDKERLHKRYFWCIDPLDGTLPFIEAVPGYSVSIALVSHDGIPMIGVIYDPLAQTLYLAINGQGAWRNRQALKVQPMPASADQRLTFITDKSFAREPICEATLIELERIARELGYAGSTVLLQGGAAMNACQVLEHSSACYVKFPKPQHGGGSVWDYAASSCLFKEAGTPVSDIHGNPLVLNPLDGTFMNHCGVLYGSNQLIANRIMELYRHMKAAF